MAFVEVNEDMENVRRLNQSKMTGKCMGLSCAWVVDIFRGRIKVGEEPDFHKGVYVQGLYEFNFMRQATPEVNNAGFFRSLTMLDKYDLKREIESGKSRSIKIINKLSKATGVVGVVACWSYRNAEDNKRSDLRYRSGGHAIGLIKQPGNGGIYLFDSNYGIYKWEQQGMPLDEEVKRYLLEKRIYGVHVWPNATMKVYKK